MNTPCVLVVDDEENIRRTLCEALKTLDVQVASAANGDEALAIIEQQPVSVVLLDLRMPGMDGMEVLRRLSESRPELAVIIITAHGTVESAVDAMKLGAIEFLQKPFEPQQVRQLVNRVLRRQALPESESDDYSTCFELAKRCLSQRRADAAIVHLHKAVAIAPERPEAFNLLGAIHEVRGEVHEALNNYRAAWSFDPTYEAARKNIERATSAHPRSEPITFGELREPPPPAPEE